LDFLEKLEAEIVHIRLPTENDYSLLRELFVEEDSDISWDYKEGEAIAIRFTNLEKLQQALTMSGPDLIDAIKENDMEKLKTALSSVVEELEKTQIYIELSEEDVEGYGKLADEARQLRKQQDPEEDE